MEFKSSDEVAFRQVYANLFPVVMKVAYHITNNADIAEDISQEAFIKFFDSDKLFPSEDDARFWLIRVVKNLAINHIRKREKEAASMDRLRQAPMPDNPFRDGASELLLKESQMAVRKAVSQLPEKYRTVIVLVEYADLSYADVAKVLKITESNVKVRVHRARRELEALLNKEE